MAKTIASIDKKKATAVKKPREKKATTSTSRKKKVEVVEDMEVVEDVCNDEDVEEVHLEEEDEPDTKKEAVPKNAKPVMKIEVIEEVRVEKTEKTEKVEKTEKEEKANNGPSTNFEPDLKPVSTKSWAAATEETIMKESDTINNTQHNLNPNSNTFIRAKDTKDEDNDENSFDVESPDVSDSELNKLTSFNDESFFDDDKATENNQKLVKDCNEKELLEVLWKRGKDNLNIALRMQVVKLYRMLNGERLHKERPTRQKNSNKNSKENWDNRENHNQNTRDFKNKGKFRREDFPSRYQKDADGKFKKDTEDKYNKDDESKPEYDYKKNFNRNERKFNNSFNNNNNDDESNSQSTGRWNRQRPPYRGRTFEQPSKNT